MSHSSIHSAEVNPSNIGRRGNPTPFTAPHRGPEPLSAARSPKGRYTSPDTPYAVQEVFIPGAWAVGYRVGPQGRIYANREAAVRFARTRMAKLRQVAVQAN